MFLELLEWEIMKGEIWARWPDHHHHEEDFIENSREANFKEEVQYPRQHQIFTRKYRTSETGFAGYLPLTRS